MSEAKIVTGPLIDPHGETRDDCAVIALKNVTREYAGHGSTVRALADATFSIVAGEWVAITGPSGSGKSTLVNLIGCLDRPTAGQLKIDNVDVASMTDEAEARAALVRVGLGERVSHLPSELSGGEQQRVCIARALINNPPILLADEPTGNLDAANQTIVAELLQDLHRNGHTIVMVTHDPEMAGLAQRRIALSHGKVFCHPVGGPMVTLRR